MKEGALWRTGVMEGPCAVVRGKDINTAGQRQRFCSAVGLLRSCVSRGPVLNLELGGLLYSYRS
jgi:hypothetical protein